MPGAIAKANQILAETPDGYMLQQFCQSGESEDSPSKPPDQKSGTTPTAKSTFSFPASALAAR